MRRRRVWPHKAVEGQLEFEFVPGRTVNPLSSLQRSAIYVLAHGRRALSSEDTTGNSFRSTEPRRYACASLRPLRGPEMSIFAYWQDRRNCVREL